MRFLCTSALTWVLLSGACPAMAQPTESEAADQIKQWAKAKAAQFEARVGDACHQLEGHPRLQGLTLEQRKELFEFTVGNTLFAVVHEMGHAAISEMGLPVLGREGDAADAYAVLAMLRVGSDFSDRVLVEASTGWFMSDKRNQKEKIRPAFYDEHGLDQQRAYQIVCLMVGSGPERFAEAASKAKMPEDRQGTCQGDYSNASWSWNTLLKPHLRAADQPKQKIDAVYGPAEGRLAVIAQAFRTIRLLETVADFAAERYVWRAPMTLEMQTCGDPGAHWDVATHKLTVCYEMAADYADLYPVYGLRSTTKAFKGKTR